MNQPLPYSAEAHTASQFTYQLAQDRGHATIYPEHLLLSLIAYRNYRAFAILQSLRAEMETLKAQCELALSGRPDLAREAPRRAPEVSREMQAVVQEAADLARGRGQGFVDTAFLLLGLLRPELRTSAILKQQSVTAAFIQQIINDPDPLPMEKPPDGIAPQGAVAPPPAAPLGDAGFRISPVFLLILFLTMGAGYAAFSGLFNSVLSVFLFVTGGWIVSLCLHEFGHAALAYWAGDKTVADKGYLTLNPARYTHGLMSIVFPLIIVALGGIGLPGGAVYIRQDLIRERFQLSLVSAAGPFATGVVAALLSLPFLLGIADFQANFQFWAGMALLAFFQVTALFFNLLPLPGLDGFGIIAPYLPEPILRVAYSLGRFTYFLIFFLFLYPTRVQEWFWLTIFSVVNLIGIDFQLVLQGFDLYRFWQ
jgi:Zn-dependent protease